MASWTQATQRVFTACAPAPSTNIAPMPAPPPDAQGRRAAGVMIDGVALRGFPTPSGKLEFYSSTLAAWGWPELAMPTSIESHVAPSAMDAAAGEVVLVPTFRLPVLIHTRSGNAKWLNELAHANPLWIHTSDAAKLGVDGRRSAARHDGDRLFRGAGVGHGGDSSRRRRVLAPHGTMAPGRRRRAPTDGARRWCASRKAATADGECVA